MLSDVHRYSTAWHFFVVAAWRIGNAFRIFSINEANLSRAQLVLWWMTVSGFNFRCRTFISVWNQPSRPTQPFIPPGSENEDQLRLGRQRPVWFILLADERGVCR